MTLAVLIAAATAINGPLATAQPDSLADQIAAADAELKAAQAQLADTFEAFSTANQHYTDMAAAATAAQQRVATTRAEADAAAGREQTARTEFDQFASASFRHGTAIFSARAYFGSPSPSDLLDRASFMGVLAAQNGAVMDATEAAVVAKAEADQQARTALTEAEKNRDAANNARVTAEQAYNTAVAVQEEAQAEASRLASHRASLVARQNDSAGGGDSGRAAGPAPPVTASAGGVVKPAQGRLTSTYGARWGTIHFGIDIANSIGTPILSAMAGTVIDSGPASGFGLWVRVRHANGLVTVYGHINESLVSVGQQVAAGQQIATLGNRGQSTGPHLHFEVHQDGRKIDPLPWLRGHGIDL